VGEKDTLGVLDKEEVPHWEAASEEHDELDIESVGEKVCVVLRDRLELVVGDTVAEKQTEGLKELESDGESERDRLLHIDDEGVLEEVMVKDCDTERETLKDVLLQSVGERLGDSDCVVVDEKEGEKVLVMLPVLQPMDDCELLAQKLEVVEEVKEGVILLL
jgi:hypothetical protein